LKCPAIKAAHDSQWTHSDRRLKHGGCAVSNPMPGLVTTYQVTTALFGQVNHLSMHPTTQINSAFCPSGASKSNRSVWLSLRLDTFICVIQCGTRHSIALWWFQKKS